MVRLPITLRGLIEEDTYAELAGEFWANAQEGEAASFDQFIIDCAVKWYREVKEHR